VAAASRSLPPLLLLLLLLACGCGGGVVLDWLDVARTGYVGEGALLANQTQGVGGTRFWTGYDPAQQLFRLNSQAPALPVAAWRGACLDMCTQATDPPCAGVFFATGLWCAGLRTLGPAVLAPTQQLSMSVRWLGANFTTGDDGIVFSAESCPPRCQRCAVAATGMRCEACSDTAPLLHDGNCLEACPEGWIPQDDGSGDVGGGGGSGDGPETQPTCRMDPCQNVTCVDDSPPPACRRASVCVEGECVSPPLEDGTHCDVARLFNAYVPLYTYLHMCRAGIARCICHDHS